MSLSTVTSPSRISKDAEFNKVSQRQPESSQTTQPPVPSTKLEQRLNINDLKALQEAFMTEEDGYENRLSLTRDQFCDALVLLLNKGRREEYGTLFDKIDVTKEGTVDWDKFASHMLLEFYEKDDRQKSTQVPQWKDLKHLPSPHKELIQKITYLEKSNRYLAISKEGCVSMWGPSCRLQRSLKTGTDTCRMRDLWVTHFVVLHNINKIALAFTSKEIAFYDLSTKLEFNCQYKVQGLDHTPLSMDYWPDPENINDAILVWGDTGGYINALHFLSASIALFERPPAPAGEKQEPCLNVQLKDVMKYRNARFSRHEAHSEWVRKVVYSHHLECFISCATTYQNSLVIGWMEKHTSTNQKIKTSRYVASKAIVRTTQFNISQGVNAFDYHEQLNLIATAGVNHHVCLWNPYVVSKPNGVLRGHMASVVQVQFNKGRGQLFSFSKDKVLRIWDVQLQVCIQRLAGMFPKGPEVTSTLFFDEAHNKLFITFNYQLTLLEMKPEIRGRVMSHEKPVVAAIYNSTYNQVVSVCQGGTVIIWMIDTGQKVKYFKTHSGSEVTALAQDTTETRIYTGSTDGTVKIWDFNGHCYHTLACNEEGQPTDVGQILGLKRSIIAVGGSKYITVFRNQSFRDFHVLPSDWKGGQEHSDDILAVGFSAPNTLVTGSYDGEIVVWNNNSELASKRFTQRCRKTLAGAEKSFVREVTGLTEKSLSSRPATGPASKSASKSRAMSKTSFNSGDDSGEFEFAISKLVFLDGRKKQSASGGANLVSCGGNGWVRFWSTANTNLLGEYIAHTHVGNVTMATDADSHWLVTGDTDGVVKVWDISEYCKHASEEIIHTPPPLHSQWQPHNDIITSLEVCVRNDRTLVLSASMDCSVALWDIYGNQIGIFGQEEHWKIEPYIPKEENDDIDNEEEENIENFELELEEEDDWIPDDDATSNPATYRYDTWNETFLGKDYQEGRRQKRERRQPQTIPDLPYLHWERTGQAPAGPYAALDTLNLNEVDQLRKPDFMANPHKYFTERTGSADSQGVRLPVLAENPIDSHIHTFASLKAAFDEKTLFPKYILDFEAKMKQYHQTNIKEQQKKAGLGLLKGAGLGGQTTTRESPKRNLPLKSIKLKPISAKGE